MFLLGCNCAIVHSQNLIFCVFLLIQKEMSRNQFLNIPLFIIICFLSNILHPHEIEQHHIQIISNSTFILNESSKHPKLTLKDSSTSSISYSSNRPKHLINLDLSIVLICLHIIIESCSRSSRLLIKTCVGKFYFFAT